MTERARPVKFRVKFADGPAAGITTEYDKEVQTVQYFTWTYEATGRRDGDFWLFVLRSKDRMMRRFIKVLTEQTGTDPRLAPKRQPAKVIRRGRNEPCWCGSGKKFKRCHASPQSS